MTGFLKVTKRCIRGFYRTFNDRLAADLLQSTLVKWLGSVTLACRTSDPKVSGLIPA